MIDDVMKDAEDRMKKAIEALKRDLQTIRTGRATPALIDFSLSTRLPSRGWERLRAGEEADDRLVGSREGPLPKG